MAKVLLVDTNFSAGPIHAALLAMGHETHVVGREPQDCLAKICPNYWHLDYSDTGALAALVDRERFDALVPGCTDRSYASCVEVGQGRFPGLDSRDAWHSVHNKGALRRVLADLGLPAPGAIGDGPTDPGSLAIVKPVDAFSGKGTTVVRSDDEDRLSEAIAAATASSPTGQYLVEAFVDGQLFSHSSFLSQGRIVHDVFVREDGSANPFVVDTSSVVPRMDVLLAHQIRSAVERLACKLELVDGLLHTQFIARGTSFWLIELTRRCPGDLYSQLIELSTGFAYSRAYTAAFLGDALPMEHEARPPNPILRHTVSLDAPNTLAHVHFRQPLLVERWTPLALVGDHIHPSPLSRIGILFCRTASQDALDTLYRQFLARDVYEIKAS